MSPMVAIRTASLIASVEMPKRAASSMRGVTRISGRSAPAEGATLLKPGRRRMALSSLASAWSKATGSVPSRERASSRSPRSFTYQPRTSGMPARVALSSDSICFWVRPRSFLGTRLTIILARRISAPAPVGVVPPTTNTVVTSGTLRKAVTIWSVVRRVSSSLEPGGSSIDSTARASSARRDEAGGQQGGGPERQGEGGQADDQGQAAAAERAAQEGGVGAHDAAFPLAVHGAGLEQVGRHQRGDQPGDQERGDDGGGDGEAELLEVLPGDAAHEADRARTPRRWCR